jgi:mevalonate pyrophosphate decarboxylase
MRHTRRNQKNAIGKSASKNTQSMIATLIDQSMSISLLQQPSLSQ